MKTISLVKSMMSYEDDQQVAPDIAYLLPQALQEGAVRVNHPHIANDISRG